MPTCPKCRGRLEAGIRFCPKDGSEVLPDEAFVSADLPFAKGAVIGEYEVVEPIAEGGFGTVYRSVHPLIGKEVAIKVLKREFSANPEMVSRFISEARAVNQIRHKNIVDIFAFGVLPDGRHYCVMELLEGVTLDRFIEKRGGIPPLEALPIVRQLGRALGAAHASGITHRDIKPENVFLVFDDDGHPEPKLLDFGIAKLVDRAGEAPQVTRPGAPMGTPLYMSPEQVFARGVDHRSDIYSFGILVHEMLVGRPPFHGETIMDVLNAQTSKPAPPMSSERPDLPPELDAPVLAMLEKDADARPGSISLAVERFFEAAERAGIAPRSSTPSGRLGASKLGAAQALTPSVGSPTARHSQTPSVATTLPQVSPRPPDRKRLVAAGMVGAVALGAFAFVLSSGAGPGSGNRGGLAAASAVGGGAAPVVDPLGGSTEPVVDPLGGSTEPGVDPLGGSTEPALTARPADSAPGASASAPAEVAPMVTLTLTGVPADAEILVAGKPRGRASEPIAVPRSEEQVEIVVSRAGFSPRKLQVIPREDQKLAVTLTPLPSGKTGPPVQGAGQRKGPSGDLEF